MAENWRKIGEKIFKYHVIIYTVTEKEVAVRPVWFVVNTLGIKKAFNNKEEALKKAKEINEVIIETLKH